MIFWGSENGIQPMHKRLEQLLYHLHGLKPDAWFIKEEMGSRDIIQYLVTKIGVG